MASMDEDWDNEENDVKDDWGDDAAAADDGEGWDDDNDNGWGDEHDPLSESTELTIAPSSVPLMKRATSYVVMETSALEKKEAALIAQTAEVLDVTQNEAGCLLRHYGWKSRKLQTEWFADQKKVRETVGITSEEDKVVSTESVRQCESAYCDEVAVELGHALNCGHFFCGDCWEAYLTSQIQHGAASIFTKCMGMKCKEDHPHKFGCSCREMVPMGLFFRFVKDQTLLEKYKRWLLDSFVEGQKNIKWCPKPGCVNAVFYNSGGTTAVQCRCGHYFCFSCNEDAHSPAPCDLVAKWLLREKSDDATAIWLAARTKECPKCSVRIEKNKACNHMKCVKCGHDFCWLCKGPWSSHGSQSGGYYVCNKYDADIKEGKVSNEEKDILDNQKLLQKYTYYYKRFKSSADAIALTQKLGIKLEKAMKDEDISKHSFIQEAIEKLIAARRVLQWTYMLSYYLKSGGKKHLFEYQQEMLISNTEALQDIMESNDGPKLLALRKDVINRTSSIDKFRAEMVQQVERGDFEDLLLSKADLDIDNWACSNCKSENKKEATFCSGCQACRKHGEPDCKACKPPS